MSVPTSIKQLRKNRPSNGEKQPAALFVVSSVEMWERFSYYGMQAILVYYIYYASANGGLGLSPTTATTIVGLYGGTVYLTAVFGGWVSDRLLGVDRTIFISAIIVLAGHLSLGFIPGITGLAIGLTLVAIGSGPLKCTASTLVGSLYLPDDPRREPGFTIYYLGVNIGAFLGITLTALLQKQWGFHVGFGAAALGMAIGLVTYAATRPILAPSTRSVDNPASARETAMGVTLVGFIVLAVLALTMSGIITINNSATILALVSALIAGLYLWKILTSRSVTAAEKSHVRSYIPIFLASSFYFAMYLQVFTSIAVFADVRTDRRFFGFELPPSTVIALAPICTIALAPLAAILWKRLGERQPSVGTKYAITLMIIGLSFVSLGVLSLNATAMLPILVLLAVIFLVNLADIVSSPAGLSFATKTSPHAFRSQMLSVHLLSAAIGSALSGALAQFFNPETNAGQYFMITGFAGILGSIAIYLAAGWIKKQSRISA
ncbi:peptide MFS transporter [Rhodococcus qingshengii]|uniref:peptide MFS transporter n=1 Tax=Rhodococcus qingshengii TaxID=334542 RepID=UPI0036DF717C